MSPVLTATVSVALIGLIIGLLLVFVGQKFAVETDEREAAVRDCLPGNNCGGCGFAGCDALAAAIVKGDAAVDACPVGGDQTAERIGHIMGVDTAEKVRMVAYVQCAGDCGNASFKANYVGIDDCISAVNNALFTKDCDYGCMGFGSCVKACPFDAIHIKDGIARVDRRACKACGKCVAACPRNLITLIPDTAAYMVRCSNKERGAAVKKACQAGCLGCGICTKQCQSEAVTVSDFLARIDPEKCVGCGACAEKCPAKAIEKRL